MARNEHLPIYKAAYDLCLWLEQVVRGFSRYHGGVTHPPEIQPRRVTARAEGAWGPEVKHLPPVRR